MIRKIGAGGCGNVYLCEDKDDPDHVKYAIKHVDLTDLSPRAF